MHLIVETRQLLEVVEVEVAGRPLWVRREPRARRWDLEVTRAILDCDEYLLEPLRTAGHVLRTVLDVGAHIGAFTLKVKSWWPEARVIAAEPDPDNAALFRRNTAGLEGVSLYGGAVLGRSGVTEVWLRQAGRANADGNAAASSVTEVLAELCPGAAPPTAVVAAIDVIDLLARHGDPEIDLLKLDCEGAEGEILERLRATGRMRGIGWIRGEWHFLPNLGRIAAALDGTHAFMIQRGEAPWGPFIAHRKP
ncbi:MAG TPA: FkbM family methyltransferase [Thermoanaerobaculia bacterium]|nr:FkbM family methyltransferase [Thermoanaerobaculia bacterium]